MMMMPPNTTTAATASSSSSSARSKSMALQQQQQQQQNQHAAAGTLKCPRCDSSNTKFCYYNNYSLSQPRHFCKACKRYWTRGGTLRNVPVGGGCRKNKRVKKTHPQPQPQLTTTVVEPPSSSVMNNLPTTDLTSFFYGSFSSSTAAAYDALGLGGLSAGLINTNLAELQQPAASAFLNNGQYSASFGSQAASLLVSSLKQPVKVEDQYQSLLPYDGLQLGCASANLGFMKGEGDYNLMGNNTSSDIWPTNLFDVMNGVPMNGASDSSYLYWNPAIGDT